MQTRDKRFLMSSGSHTGRGQIKGSHFRVRDVKAKDIKFLFIYLFIICK